MDHPKGDTVRALAWSPDGNNLRLVTVGDSGVMRIWLYSDGEHPWNRKGDIKDFRGSNILDVAWSFDSNIDILALYTRTASGSNVWTLNLLNNNTVSNLGFFLDAEQPEESSYPTIVPSSIAWSPFQGNNHLYLAYAIIVGTPGVYVWDNGEQSNTQKRFWRISIPSGIQIASEIQMAWYSMANILRLGRGGAE